MSKASTDYKDKLHGAMSEIVAGQSALNMEASPIQGATGYLTNTDLWVKDAAEHFHAAFVLCEAAKTRQKSLVEALEKLLKLGAPTYPCAPGCYSEVHISPTDWADLINTASAALKSLDDPEEK